MQHSDDRPPPSGRPSLLSAEQQGEADRQRILSGLESKPSLTTAGAKKSRSGAMKWAVAGAAVLALSAGAGVWLVSEGEKEIVLAGTAPLPATPAPAAPLASEPATSATIENVPASAILQDTPVMADQPVSAILPMATAAPAVAAAGAKKSKDDLKSVLEHGLPAMKKPPATVPLVLADAAPYAGKPVADKPATPVKAAAPVKPATPAKAAPAKGTGAKPAPKKSTPAKADAKAKAKPAPAPAKKKEAPNSAKMDTDVALLSALVAHSKATQTRQQPTTAAAKLKQCKSLGSVTDAERCKAQLCAGSAKKEAECKAPRLAKAADS